MKKIILVLLLSATVNQLHSQGLAVNSTGGTADGSAMLDISAVNKGFLLPRMTLVQRTAIATPATGLLVYQTDGLNGFYYNAGTPAVPNWIRLNAENYWTLSGNNIYNNNTGNVGVGTTNPLEKLHVVSTSQNTATFSGANQMYLTLSENGSPKGYIGSFNQSVSADDVDFGTYGATTGALHLITQATPRLTVSNTGNIGIGTTTPNAPLQIANNNLLNRKIVLYETANNNHEYAGFSGNGSLVRYQAPATTTSHVFYAAANATNSFELMRITGTGNVGIGNSSPLRPLSFSFDFGKKISLYAGTTGDAGFGVFANELRIHSENSNADITLGYDDYTLGFTERVRITGGGNVGIGTASPNAPLQFAADTRNRKIVLFEVANNDHQFYGFGVNGGILRYQAGTGVDNHVFYAGTSATTSSELMRITGAGNVGIGGITPGYRLDVNGRMRIRSVDATTNSAGVWLNASTNTERAFIGMENDNSVGLFGNNGAGWAFVMNTQTGKLRYQDGTQANGRVLTSDANGVASWVTDNTVQSVRTGSFGGGANFDYNEMGSFPSAGTSKYTTVNITLPPGRWVVFANLLINGTALPSGGGIFVRTYLAESATVATASGDVVPGTGGLISGNISFSNTFSFVSGQVFINNTTGANKTYFLWANASRNTSAPSSGSGIGALGSSFWAENQLFAVPMN